MATARATRTANLDARVDAKIASASPTLQPLLEYMRELVHEAVPDATETIKWGMPFFELNGVILAHLAAFKQHCAFGFWSKTMTEHLIADGLTPQEGAGSFGKITRMEDLPPRKKFLGYIRLAAEHIRKGIAESPMQARAAANRESKEGVSRRGPDGNASSKAAVAMPPAFAEALANSPVAKQNFEAFPSSCRREYLVWITEAKRDETRTRRIRQAVQQIAEGKRHNWQYETKR